jgi:hypothetical protein
MKTTTHLITIIVLLLAPLGGYCKDGDKSPLAVYSAKWNDPKYRVCNTAEKVGYMTEKEKELIYVLNLARMNPKLFSETVLPRAHDISSFIDTTNEVYYKTLVATMSQMTPLGILQPDSLCMVSARCHAITSGKVGYVWATKDAMKNAAKANTTMVSAATTDRMSRWRYCCCC